MPPPTCESLVEATQKLTQDLIELDVWIDALGAEGMSQLNPWRYLALQPQVDHLIKKKHALQEAWNRTMAELAICRSDQPLPHHPREEGGQA